MADWREIWIEQKDGRWFVKEVGGGWGMTHGPYRWWINRVSRAR